MVPSESKIISVGVDYVTATQITNGRTTDLARAAAEWLDAERRAGNECREFTSHSFSGLWAGCVGVGTNGTRLLVKVGGFEAHTCAEQILRQADSISRLDLQITVRMPSVPLSFAERMERACLRFKHKKSAKFDVDLRRHDRKGKTLYLGSRASERFIRVYDKGKQSQHPDLIDCWRAEVQYSKPQSFTRAHQLLQMSFDKKWIAEVVVYELSRRGLNWGALLDGAVTEQPSETFRRRSDFARALSWLNTQVRPTVDKLIDAGMEEQVLEALNLTGRIETGVSDAASH